MTQEQSLEKVHFNEWAVNLAEQLDIARFGKPLRNAQLARRAWEKQKRAQQRKAAIK
jgi:hypothetical protein